MKKIEPWLAVLFFVGLVIAALNYSHTL